MKVLFIARATLYKDRGGDTVQLLETAEQLRKLQIEVDIRLTSEAITYEQYDLLHFFNIIRPADILYHIRASGKPYVVSTIFVDYSEYEKTSRKGFAGLLFRLLSSDQIEYLKVVARRVMNGERIVSSAYLWYGQGGSIRRIMRGASMLLPNSASEYSRLRKHFKQDAAFEVIPNAIDPLLFQPPVGEVGRQHDLIICVGRIEGRKNQLNLIHALNGTAYRLFIIGSASANQAAYYKACKDAAGPNVQFISGISQTALAAYYSAARVHVLPSWFETTGLSSLEAAAMGCALVITDKGDTREYFEDYVFYCDPASVDSIRAAVEMAATTPWSGALQRKIFSEYTWEQTALRTAGAYRKILPNKFPEK